MATSFRGTVTAVRSRVHYVTHVRFLSRVRRPRRRTFEIPAVPRRFTKNSTFTRFGIRRQDRLVPKKKRNRSLNTRPTNGGTVWASSRKMPGNFFDLYRRYDIRVRTFQRRNVSLSGIGQELRPRKSESVIYISPPPPPLIRPPKRHRVAINRYIRRSACT